ncbi:MAG: response regulator mprA [Ilumatobacteraceae bacterium]|nr:response regulator mprA [Ilumatobacteraceae bacterium]
MRVLVVEDHLDTSELIRLTLTRDHQVVEVASTGEEALWMAEEFEFDLVLLDLALPDTDGVDVCRTLREREQWMPILMLTGHAAIEQRVTGLNAGADDYLTKPFAPSELVARIHALHRRAPKERPTVLTVGTLTLDPQNREVRRDGAEVRLRPKEFSLLHLLMNRPGEVLDRAEILDSVWDMNYDGMSNTVDVHVKSLRSKIDKPFGCDTIETVWRVGYRLRVD